MGTLSQATSLPGRRPGDAARARRARWRRHLRAHLYVAPAVIPVVVLLYLPFLWTAYLSITRYDGLTPPVRIGLTNYREFLHDPVLATSVRNTLLWVVGTVLLPVGLGLVVAVLTYDLPRGTLWRLPFLLPVAFSGVGSGWCGPSSSATAARPTASCRPCTSLAAAPTSSRTRRRTPSP